MGTLPCSVDLRPKLPPVYRQGRLDSCAAQAIAAALAIDLPFAPSRLFIHYNAREAPRLMRHAIAAVAEHGFCSEEEWPYDPARAGTRPPDSVYESAVPYRGCEARRLEQDLDSLKCALAAGRPLVCGLMVHYRFVTGEVQRSGVIPLPDDREPRLGGHAVAVVGYDDLRECFRIRNSMGSGWGEGGYGWAPYAYLADPRLAADFWSLRPR
jgi:C1A family cysteine protease